VREALRCAVERHGKRRGLIAPTRGSSGGAVSSGGRVPTQSAPPGAASRAVAPPRTGAPLAQAPAAAPPSAAASSGVPGASAPTALSSTAVASTASTSSASASSASSASPPPSVTATPVAVRTGAPSRETSARARVIPAAVRRAVWARDQGCCSWRSRDGRRCGSRWKLELDHIVPVALGGESTEENLRLICRPHNVRHAEQIFGKHHMSRFTVKATQPPQGGGGG
jgi:hypothetical protein